MSLVHTMRPLYVCLTQVAAFILGLAPLLPHHTIVWSVAITSFELQFFFASFYEHATILGLVSKLVVLTSCVTLRALIFYV